uniref:Transmembrane protein n=1 Tax=Caenorhabditis tropicalis TaxID=1561998 RepID=A0A1I7UGN9_9PELO
MAWISAPLLISANVFLHACIRQFSTGNPVDTDPSTNKESSESLVFSGIVFGFFLLTGVGLTLSLFLAHTVALRHVRPGYFLPYAIVKAIRIVTLTLVSFAILFSPTLIKTYFYASIYGLFEAVAGAIALEVTIRCIHETKRIRSGRRRQTRADANLPPNIVSKSTLIQENC